MLTIDLLKKDLEKTRLANFPNFSKIILKKSALKLLKNLFLNPDCIALSDLNKFASRSEVKLQAVAREIITAAPQGLARFCLKNNLLILDKNDLLKYYFLDHLIDIKNNKIAENFSPFYALSHALLLGKITKIKSFSQKKVAQVSSQFSGKEIIFKNLIIADDFDCHLGDLIFHHFGVVISQVENISLAKKLTQKQINNQYFYQCLKNIPAKTIIDFGKKNVFHEDFFAKNLNGPLKKDFYKNQKISEKKKQKIFNSLKRTNNQQKVIFSH